MQHHAVSPHTRYIRRPDVEALTGLSTSTIYKLMTEGQFPRQIKLTRKAVAWNEAEILDWLASRPTVA
ncbi:AlpA family transcriptional regulator [Paracoccus sp. Z330]|uniref:AlpA family transcriptional regulator n=1 Tax=Paracoccus onchidii TaxID=3017813 RepID=A0ABT4ZJM2_9RHOB|nr:AlpA family transcriptional regulator [Paracoccus onchidii]MDB6179541.1 AlpA family transcriptional regulator [Paracoccus onchidii]